LARVLARGRRRPSLLEGGEGRRGERRGL
jgi:hypothetical protein